MTKITIVKIKNISNQIVTLLYNEGVIEFGKIPKNNSGLIQLYTNQEIEIELNRLNIGQLHNFKTKKLIDYSTYNYNVVNESIHFDYQYSNTYAFGDSIDFYSFNVITTARYWFCNITSGDLGSLVFNRLTGTLSGVFDSEFECTIGMVNTAGQIYSVDIELTNTEILGVGSMVIGTTFIVR